MSERAAFLNAIRAQPADDLARLVFADWLDEAGDPLGEFIRVQIALEGERDRTDAPHVRELLRREAELLIRYRTAWLGPVADLEQTEPQFGPVFVRGLPERVSLSLETFLSRGEELFRTCPTLREVAVFAVAGRGRELAACPHLAHVDTLEIADWLDERDPARIDQSPFLGRLQVIRLWMGGEFQYDGWCLRPYLARARTGRALRVEAVALASLGYREETLTGWAEQAGGTVLWPFRARFPLAGDLGHGLLAGHLPSGAPVIAAITLDRRTVYLTTFDAGGGFSKTVWEQRRTGTWNGEELNRRFGFTPGRIEVREFRSGGLAVRLWPESYVRNYLRDPFIRPPLLSDREWRNRGGVIRRWRERGFFAIEWDGRELWVDRTGTVVVT